jgi:hypothetical protein
MKNVNLLTRRLTLALVMSIALALSGVALAQNATQTDKKAESCCAMECCKEGECSMKDHAKSGHSKDHSKHSKDGGCCCKGDSCNVNMKDTKDKKGS